MGLLSRLQFILNGGSKTDEDRSEEYGPFNLPPRERVTPDRRTNIIATNYEPISREQAQALSSILKEAMDSSQVAPRDVRKRFESEVGVDSDLAERIANTEIKSVYTEDDLRRYAGEDFEVDVEWLPPGDGNIHPVCQAVVDEVENQGGHVSIEELQSIFRDKASEFEDDGGTPERVDHWIPHEGNCRCTISPVLV